MCGIEYVRHYWVKTRKPHSCMGCCEPMPKGTKAKSCTNTFEGEIYTYWLCIVCDAAMNEFLSESGVDCYAQGEIKEEMPNLWERTKKELDRLSKLATTLGIY